MRHLSFLSSCHLKREGKKSDLPPNNVRLKHLFCYLHSNHILPPENFSAFPFPTVWSLKLLSSPLLHTTLITSFPQPHVHSWLDSSLLPYSSNHVLHIPLSAAWSTYSFLNRPIHPKGGTCSACQNTGKPSTFHMACPQTPKLYTNKLNFWDSENDHKMWWQEIHNFHG
jgi:hypothetical protein